MTLLDKSLKLALLASAVLLTACPAKDEDTGETADTEETDTDDTEEEIETGITQFYFLADFSTTDGAYADAHFGYGFYGLKLEDWICTVKGTLPYVGDAPAGCPECEWSFDLGAAENGVTEGEYCEQLGLDGTFVNGRADYAWGWADTYYYDFEGTPLTFTNAVMLYITPEPPETDGWFAFAANYNGNDQVFGDSTSAEVERAIVSEGQYVYYYYYPY